MGVQKVLKAKKAWCDGCANNGNVTECAACVYRGIPMAKYQDTAVIYPPPKYKPKA